MEEHPSFTTSPAAGITDVHKDNWSAAYGWGDKGTEGYMKVEEDPSFTTSQAVGNTDVHKVSWSAAHGWSGVGTDS